MTQLTHEEILAYSPKKRQINRPGMKRANSLACFGFDLRNRSKTMIQSKHNSGRTCCLELFVLTLIGSQFIEAAKPVCKDTGTE